MQSQAPFLLIRKGELQRVDGGGRGVDQHSRRAGKLAELDQGGDPAVAAPWAAALGANTENFYMLENLGRRWLDIDEKAATDWINRSALPEDRKQRLLKRGN